MKKKGHKKAQPTPKSSSTERRRPRKVLAARKGAAESFPLGPKTRHGKKGVAMPSFLEMEIQKKKSHGRPAPSESKEPCAKKKLKLTSPIVTSLVVTPPAVTSPVVTSPILDPKEKALAVTPVCRCPRLAVGASEVPV